MKRIILGYDATPAADHALERTAEFARAFGATVTVASVARALTTSAGRGIGPVDPVDPPSLHRQEADEAKDRLGARGIEAEAVVGLGDPGDLIARLANERHADLVILGGRPGGQLRDLLGGSVSERVARKATCDVRGVR